MVFLRARWSWRVEESIIAMIMLFWVIEDGVWFILNPAFGWSKFSAAHIPWHKQWWGGLPANYWLACVVGISLLVWSYHSKR